MTLLWFSDLQPNRTNFESANLILTFCTIFFSHSQTDYTGFVSSNVLHSKLHLCVALGSGASMLSLDVISDIVTWPLELYYLLDQCQDLTKPDTGEPVHPPEVFPHLLWPSFSAGLRRLFSLTLLFSAEIELWDLWTWKVRVLTSRDDSLWETVRGRHPTSNLLYNYMSWSLVL